MIAMDPPDAECDETPPLFYLIPGRNGHWTARDATGRNAGYFIDYANARHYALSQNGHRPDLIVEFTTSTFLIARSDAPAAATADRPLRHQQQAA